MGEVIHVAFGMEREWEQTHAKTVDARKITGNTVDFAGTSMCR